MEYKYIKQPRHEGKFPWPWLFFILMYIGIETGHDETLSRIHKGNTAEEAVIQCKRLEEAGIA